VLAGIT